MVRKCNQGSPIQLKIVFSNQAFFFSRHLRDQIFSKSPMSVGFHNFVPLMSGGPKSKVIHLCFSFWQQASAAGGYELCIGCQHGILNMLSCDAAHKKLSSLDAISHFSLAAPDKDWAQSLRCVRAGLPERISKHLSFIVVILMQYYV